MYADLEGQGLEIIGVPCNQFGGQEPGTAEQINSFARSKYGVTFQLTEKVDVNGKFTHPTYNYLRRNSSLYDSAKK